ncbi:MAG: chase2 sensor protein [Candidatus Rokuibacteriota bacterium]|nr:MAG: chase2 sensor protein [Candidatus Rokubacteria bacterium]
MAWRSSSDGTPLSNAERSHWSERRWLRALRGARGRPLGVGLLVVLLLLLLAPEGWVSLLRPLRLAVFDAYQHQAPRARRSAPALIVAIDDASLRHLGQWPWPRTWLATLVDRVAEGRPAAIALDILMPEPDRLSPGRLPGLITGLAPDAVAGLQRLPSNDAVLAHAIRSHQVVVPMAGLDGEGLGAGGRRAPVRAFGADPLPFLRRFDAALRNLDEIDGAGGGHGLLSVDIERGVVRRVPLMAAVGPSLVPTLAIETLRVAAGVPAFAVRASARGVESVGVGDLVVPTEADGSVWIHYSPHDPSRFVSAADVLAGRVAPHLFERKLVLIGVTAVGLSDHQATPVADRMPGVEIHAQLLEDIFDGSLLSRPRWVGLVEGGLLAAGGLLLILAVPHLSARRSAGLLVALIVVLIALGSLLYLKVGILLDGAAPALSLSVLYTAMLVVTLAEGESQRRALRLEIARQREAAARLAGELEAARRIQLGSLPRAADVFANETRFDLYAFLDPAREVGGDLYDFFPLDADRLFFLIGDVSGKGLPGSLFMTMSKALCKGAALRQDGRVARVLGEAHTELSRDNAEGLFVTVLAGTLNVSTGELEYCNAGHETPYLLPRRERSLRRLDGGGPPLCAVDDFAYAATSLRLAPGDTLCLVTDGVTEAMSASGELYGRSRLASVLSRLGDAVSASHVGEAVRSDVESFAAGAERADDVAILVLRWIGPGATGR